MSQTTFATGNALTKKLWDEDLFRDIEKMSYWTKWHGKSADSLVHEKTQLEKNKGDNVTFGIRMRLQGAGVEDNALLEDNEEDLSTYSDSVSLKLYRHAIRDDGELTRKRAMFEIDAESREALKTWGTEKIDALHFDQIQSAPTLNAYLNSSSAFTLDATQADAVTGMHATNSKLTPAFISALKTYAVTGGARTGLLTPLRPVMHKGKRYYVLLTHPDALYDLKRNSEVMNAWQYAVERGDDNPLFRDAEVVWDGVCVHAHESMTIGVNGSSVPYAYGAFMGAQSLVWAYGKRPWTVQKTFDYDNQHGYAWNMIARCKKPAFNSKDYGSIGVVCARTNISGATIN